LHASLPVPVHTYLGVREAADLGERLTTYSDFSVVEQVYSTNAVADEELESWNLGTEYGN